MDIAAQESAYFAAAGDASGSGEAVPATTSGNTVVPLIDGRRYFREIRSLLNRLGTGPNVSQQFFYMTSWWLHLTPGPNTATTTAQLDPAGTPQSPTTRTGSAMPAFQLIDDQAGPYPLLAELLASKAAAGVDIRVLAWLNPLLLADRPAQLIPGYWNVAACNLLSIQDLRNRTVGSAKPLARRVCTLDLGHPLGAMHLKMVVAHDGTKPYAFTGGIDFVPNRVAGEMHPTGEDWHDMAASVDGPAVQQFYDLFRNLWNEQVSRPVSRYLLNGSRMNSVEPNTPTLAARSFPAAGTGKQRVQVAKTLPQFHYQTFRARQTPLTFAPNGLFEVKVAWRKAIQHADQYIYIEDQSFWAQDVMDWLNQKLKTNSTVKVILVTGAADPADPPNPGPLVEAVNNHLLPGLDAAQKARVGLFFRGNVIIHTKVTLIDDHWIFVGSANCMRRSLYTDGEISIGTLDENDQLAMQTRVDLWGGHFGRTPGAQRTELQTLSRALAVWDPTWGTNRPYGLPASMVRRSLPLPAVAFDSSRYNLADWDSRQPL